MEHPLHEATSAETPEELLRKLGITDDIALEEPPAWVTQELTDEQRRILARLTLNAAAGSVFLPTQVAALALFKLALQPGLPGAGAGFMVLVAADLLGNALLHRTARRLSAVDIAGALGVVSQAEGMLRGGHTPDEDLDQDAGVPEGVQA